jgi:hypothetical protein
VDWNRTHPAVLAPDGSVVTHVPTTPSDFRAIKNAIAAIKRKERSLG